MLTNRMSILPLRQSASVTPYEKVRTRIYDQAVLYVKKIFDLIRKSQKFSIKSAFELERRIAIIGASGDPVFIRAIHHDSLENYYIYHCVNIGIYAPKMAALLGWNRDRQVEIGVAALLHDVGMATVPEKLVFKKERLSGAEVELMKNRPVFSYNILKLLDEEQTWIAQTALQVHERIDGSGYPNSLKGNEIHEYAQIIGLLDIYEALIHARPQGEKLLFASAMKEIIRTSKSRFKKEYLKALVNLFTFYPPGSFVRLNSNAIGRVIRVFPDLPTRPKIRIIFDAQKRKVEKNQIINLRENSLLHIADSISIREVRGLLGSEKLPIYREEKK